MAVAVGADGWDMDLTQVALVAPPAEEGRAASEVEAHMVNGTVVADADTHVSSLSVMAPLVQRVMSRSPERGH
jgi:hypothetical protein